MEVYGPLTMEYIEIYNEKIRDLLERRKPGQVELSELFKRHHKLIFSSFFVKFLI